MYLDVEGDVEIKFYFRCCTESSEPQKINLIQLNRLIFYVSYQKTNSNTYVVRKLAVIQHHNYGSKFVVAEVFVFQKCFGLLLRMCQNKCCKSEIVKYVPCPINF